MRYPEANLRLAHWGKQHTRKEWFRFGEIPCTWGFQKRMIPIDTVIFCWPDFLQSNGDYWLSSISSFGGLSNYSSEKASHQGLLNCYQRFHHVYPSMRIILCKYLDDLQLIWLMLWSLFVVFVLYDSFELLEQHYNNSIISICECFGLNIFSILVTVFWKWIGGYFC